MIEGIVQQVIDFTYLATDQITSFVYLTTDQIINGETPPEGKMPRVRAIDNHGTGLMLTGLAGAVFVPVIVVAMKLKERHNK